MSFQTLPFTPTPQRAEVVSRVLNETIRFETVFTDYARGCDEVCGVCETCILRKLAVSNVLASPDGRSWEVWNDEGELVGLMYLTAIVPGEDATAHYCFFDGKLKAKTEILKAMIEWTFTDHDDWKALQRLSIEVPDYAFALARHAFKALGFTGDFTYERDGTEIKVEGVKRGALLWRGQRRDLLLLGLINERAA